jgi:CubicO group peptidase (beta-lactamase class C family)
MYRGLGITGGIAAALFLCGLAFRPPAGGIYFPPPGESLVKQDQRQPAAVGLRGRIFDDLRPVAERWALWCHGRLVARKGDFNLTHDVKSVAKTWHAVTLGAAIEQGRVPSPHQRVVVWNPSLTGKDREATWRHVLTQSAGFDYPCCGRPDFAPGVMWTYSQLNIVELTRALARVYGHRDQFDDYAGVLRKSYFDAIGMRGWKVNYMLDSANPRLSLDLEDMGRLGLLMTAGGRWAGKRIVPASFIDELERKQTAGMRVNYDGPNDGKVNLTKANFPEAPYGFLTWVNDKRNFYPDAAASWAWAAGTNGYYVLWNRSNGIVFAAFGLRDDQFTGAGPPTRGGVPAIIERNIRGPDPLAP